MLLSAAQRKIICYFMGIERSSIWISRQLLKLRRSSSRHIFFLKLLSAPLKLAIKLMLHAALGFLLLLVEEIIGGFFDFSLGINLINCLVAGILGIPGVIILVLIKVFL